MSRAEYDAGQPAAGAGRMPLLHRLRWYRNRLGAMSVAEVLFRVVEQQRQVATRLVRPQPATLFGRDRGDLPALPWLVAGVGELSALDAGPLAAWQAHADAVADGGLGLPALEPPWPEGRPGWPLDPVTGARWPPAASAFHVPYRENGTLGDVRYAWEVGRLQYLQPIAALALIAEDRRLAALVERDVLDFIAANPPGRGVHWSTGLQVALRTISLMVLAALLGDGMLGEPARRTLADSLAEHAWWLQRFPSRYSSANHHLLAEAVAILLVARRLPGLRHADRWAAEARATLEQEIPRQFHADGVGAEQSLAVSALALELCALAVVSEAAAGLPFASPVPERLQRATAAVAAFADRAGNRPQIGDDEANRVIVDAGEPAGVAAYADGVQAASALALGADDLVPAGWRPHLRLAAVGRIPAGTGSRPADGVRQFPDGGYTVAREGVAGHDILLVMDHGPLGYLSIAAHGHADALAVWMHVDGRPVLVDAGTYLFHAANAGRGHFRGTAAHNTLTIEGVDSSRSAGPFNWSHKARTRLDGSAAPDDGLWWVEASHDGYAAAYGHHHRRRLERLRAGHYQITDRLDGDGGVARVEIGFLVAPGLTVSNVSGGFMIAEAGRRLLFLRHEGPLKGWLERGLENPVRGWHAPCFGRREPAPRLVFAGKMWQGVVAKFTLSTDFA